MFNKQLQKYIENTILNHDSENYNLVEKAAIVKLRYSAIDIYNYHQRITDIDHHHLILNPHSTLNMSEKMLYVIFILVV